MGVGVGVLGAGVGVCGGDGGGGCSRVGVGVGVCVGVGLVRCAYDSMLEGVWVCIGWCCYTSGEGGCLVLLVALVVVC